MCPNKSTVAPDAGPYLISPCSWRLGSSWRHQMPLTFSSRRTLIAKLRLCFSPKDLVVAVRIKRRVDVNQIDASCWKFSQLLEIIAAVDDASANQRRRLCRHLSHSAESEAFGQRAVDCDTFARANIASIRLRDASVRPNDKIIARTSLRGTFTIRRKAAGPDAFKS